MSTQQFTPINLEGEIISGPSREAMFDSLRLFQSSDTLVEFLFKPEGRPQYVVTGRVQGIRAEDGSGHSWLVLFQPQAITDYLGRPSKRIRRTASSVQFVKPQVSLYYHDDKRSGCIVDGKPFG